MKSPKKVPTDRDLQAIPRWARIALAARTLRRLQPLLLGSWSKATRKFQRSVEWAIAEGEKAASQGGITPDLRKAGIAAMESYRDGPPIALPANYLAYAAARVCFGCRRPSAADAQFALKKDPMALTL
jgi:hypothetical protein